MPPQSWFSSHSPHRTTEQFKGIESRTTLPDSKPSLCLQLLLKSCTGYLNFPTLEFSSLQNGDNINISLPTLLRFKLGNTYEGLRKALDYKFIGVSYHRCCSYCYPHYTGNGGSEFTQLVGGAASRTATTNQP